VDISESLDMAASRQLRDLLDADPDWRMRIGVNVEANVRAGVERGEVLG
jgi:hypothetical protein